VGQAAGYTVLIRTHGQGSAAHLETTSILSLDPL